jgi:hypothetical protein
MKAPKQGREKETKGQGPKSRQAKEAGHKEEREPLRTEPFTRSMKHITLREGRCLSLRVRHSQKNGFLKQGHKLSLALHFGNVLHPRASSILKLKKNIIYH